MGLLKPDSSVEFLKGVGPQRAELLRKELGIHTVEDLLLYFPFRYIDRTQLNTVQELPGVDWAYLRLTIGGIAERGHSRSKVLVIQGYDHTGSVDLVWFRGAQWVKDKIEQGQTYLFYGRVQNQGYGLSIPHPEIERDEDVAGKMRYLPVYSSTEKLGSKGLNSRGLARLTETLCQQIDFGEIRENLPEYILGRHRLMPRSQSLHLIHYPSSAEDIARAQNRLRFEELFQFQLRMLFNKSRRKRENNGFLWKTTGPVFNDFYKTALPFELTGAQKRVIREIAGDLRSGKQMNRLLQGDVGSGKTIVALLTMLIAVGNGYQSCLMAPTEILAQQHFKSLKELLEKLPIDIELLTGSTKAPARKEILSRLGQGQLKIIVGTHALLEDPVIFQDLGLVVIDEQHRFGVEQRSRLWSKARNANPHVLIMSATPIPRTLAMTQYGDLDISIIDELPPGRKEIITKHIKDIDRMTLYKFMKEQIAMGRQVYVVYPLIEESELLDIENLQLGYDKMLEYFPLPDYRISVVHGKLKPVDKEMEMQRFAAGRAQIMVATTVIEVGVNVPNASVMVIENAERFGLSQLHQLRGRVGRGADQSYCILMTADRLGKDSLARMKILCSTNDGFKIAEEDLRMRGPGDLSGTKQSGLVDLQVSDVVRDHAILDSARKLAEKIIEKDPALEHPVNRLLKLFIGSRGRKIEFSDIS